MLHKIDLANDKTQRRVVVYARVSTEHEAQLKALENQKDWYSDILNMHPTWTLVRMYIDKGITGTSAHKRPNFQKMIHDAQFGEFDMIITREVSRFARNTVDTLAYTRQLKKYGVDVYFISDGISTLDEDGELRLSIMATLAQDESRKTSVRVKHGQQTSMEKGTYYQNGSILGYTRVGRNTMVIDPEQAKTVRMIFDLYLAGEGIRSIQFKLEQAGRLTAFGNKNWHTSSISKILKNPFYCGILMYHKQYTPDYLDQKKINNYGDVEFTYAEGTHEKIVTKEEFDEVQSRLESRRREHPESKPGQKRDIKGKRDPVDVWTKLLQCECGHGFHRRRWTKKDDIVQYCYQCYGQILTGSVRTRQNKGLSTEGICKSPMIPKWKLEMMASFIFTKYMAEISKAVVLAEAILADHLPMKKDKAATEEKIKRLEANADKLKKRLSGFADMRADGELTKEEFLQKKDETENAIGEIAKRIEQLKTDADNEFVEIDHENRIRFLRFALDQMVSPDDKRTIPEDVIDAFVQKIVVHQDHFDWYLRFSPKGSPEKLTVNGKRKGGASISSFCLSLPRPRRSPAAARRADRRSRCSAGHG